MILKDSMFGFELEQKKYDWTRQRPNPPEGYIEFNSNRAHCQAGKCPNCGQEKPGKGPRSDGRHGGFQDRQIQNLWRALEKINHRFCPEDSCWKPEYELFSIDLDPQQEKYSKMLKCHPSRYCVGEFTCCGAKIWHDFSSKDGKGWKHYYKPTKEKTLRKWF